MELLSAIRRHLLLRPFRKVVVDDTRAWRGIDLMVVAWHLAREIERTSKAKRLGVMLPTSALFPATAIAERKRISSPSISARRRCATSPC